VAPPVFAARAQDGASKGGYSVMVLDTAGRSQLDDELMEELAAIRARVSPVETLLVVEGMIGQEAVNIAEGIREVVPLTGVILTKMDGDARGGAAISIKAITGKPVKFIGVGEKLSELEPFHPERMSSRILGMGDVLTMIEKAQSVVDQEKAAELEQKFRKNQFTLEDFRDQMVQIRKMGSLTDLLQMIPGMGQAKQMKNLQVDEGEFVKIEAIINSMTPQERNNHNIINGSRRKRIAGGSGTKVQDINKLLKNYTQLLKMLKKFNKGGMRGMGRGMLPF